jgi:tetratricopeptide (TPR) repeat protein
MQDTGASNSAGRPPTFSAEHGSVQMQRLMKAKDFGSIDELNEYLATVGAEGLPIEAAPSTPAEKAQDLVYEAHSVEDPRRTELAMEALAVHPDCADAYTLLAEMAPSPQESLELAQKAFAAAERSLPEGCLEDPEWVGRFWGILETRPYMRARQRLAEVLYHLGDQEAAIEHYQEMLRLNPNDNQGLRYDLVAWLIEADRDQEALTVLDEYEDDPSATLAYERALIEFRKSGAGARARRALEKALRANPFVPLLCSLDEVPPMMPSTYSFGDEGEALLVAYTIWNPLIDTPNAQDWFLGTWTAWMKKEMRRPGGPTELW